MFLTPSGEPFWGGTYFPPDGRYGRPSFRDVLQAIHRLYREDPAKIAKNTAAISAHLRQALSGDKALATPTLHDMEQIATRIAAAADQVNGGMGGAPKFPNATMWEALFRQWVRSREPAVLQTCTSWIGALCKGGIYDHLAGGIHRYTVDGRWLVPHFEKMLYDNAQFIRTLCLCHAATGKTLFRTRIEKAAAFVLTSMRAPGGAFFSSFDADSEGEEGRYYVWTRKQIDDTLGADADPFCRSYDVTAAGNWEGKSILNQLHLSDDDAVRADARLASSHQTLLAERQRRISPACDDKILVDWNGLAIRALVEAGDHLDRPQWRAAAAEAFGFVSESIRLEGRLAHAYSDGSVSGPATASDLAAMINAAISLSVSHNDKRFLRHAEDWAEELEASYSDGTGGYFLTAAQCDDLVIRPRSDQDEAVPSASAMAIEALARLGLATGKPIYGERADRALSSAWGRIKENPFSSVGIANAADTVLRAPKLILTGPAAALYAVAQHCPDPARVDMRLADEAAISTHLGSIGRSKSPRAFLCRGLACLPPVDDPAELKELLGSQPG